ncbi:SNARE-binding exocyst subunit S6, partial [Coemansia sp. RSA 2673]
FYRQFSEFHEQYVHVREMLGDAKANFEQGDFNLLRLHYFLHKLEDFRNRAMGFSGVSDADSEQTLTQMFGGLDGLVHEFEQFLWHEREAAGAGLARRQSAAGGARATQKESGAKMMMTTMTTTAAAGRGEPRRERRIKHYRQKLLDLLRQFISGRVSEFFKKEAKGLDGVEEVTGFVIDELTFVAEAVVPAFPSSYFMFDFFVNEYHQAVVRNSNALVAGDLEGGAILMLLRWVREYHTGMRKQLSISKDQLKPALLEGREDQLAQEYLEIAVSKIREWISNLMRTEASTFAGRQDAPSMGEDGLYVTGASVYLFEIVNQNIDLVIEAQRAKMLCDLMAECNKVFQDTSKQWRELLE